MRNRAFLVLACLVAAGALSSAAVEVEQREDGRLSYQSVMIEPGREYAANRDPNFLYPLKVGGLSGDHNTGDGIVTSSVQLTDPSQHANYRLDHDQIVELLHRLHSYGRSNFEDWLRQHILKDQQ